MKTNDAKLIALLDQQERAFQSCDRLIRRARRAIKAHEKMCALIKRLERRVRQRQEEIEAERIARRRPRPTLGLDVPEED